MLPIQKEPCHHYSRISREIRFPQKHALRPYHYHQLQNRRLLRTRQRSHERSRGQRHRRLHRQGLSALNNSAECASTYITGSDRTTGRRILPPSHSTDAWSTWLSCLDIKSHPSRSSRSCTSVSPSSGPCFAPGHLNIRQS